MSNVVEVQIDPEIVLDPVRTANMPDQVRGGLLVAMTLACKKYDCLWTNLTWEVKLVNNEPIIKVKHVPN